MNVDAISVCFVILPLTFEDITINMPKLSLSASLVVSPIAFVSSTVWPHLNTVAVLHVS
jgi:hypothetical protein